MRAAKLSCTCARGAVGRTFQRNAQTALRNAQTADIFRVIDANLNRSREGLRVCEEITRFIIGSAPLTRDLKEVRHRISGIAKDIASGTGRQVWPKGTMDRLLAARDVSGDVGRVIKPKSETFRKGCADIFSANIERVKESLRVLEEFSKLYDRALSLKFSRLRFRIYDIEKRSINKIKPLRNIG